MQGRSRLPWSLSKAVCTVGAVSYRVAFRTMRSESVDPFTRHCGPGEPPRRCIRGKRVDRGHPFTPATDVELPLQPPERVRDGHHLVEGLGARPTCKDMELEGFGWVQVQQLGGGVEQATA